MNLFKNPWVTLILGMMLGLTLGYVFAELQPVPPARAVAEAVSSANGGLPPNHPPISGQAQADNNAAADEQQLRDRAGEIKAMLKQRPDDTQLMVALGNLYFDHSRWPEARDWYDKALAIHGDDPNVLTDQAVVYRNLGDADKALELLNRALGLDPEHWQALYNKVVVLNYDLHRHDEAIAALAKLEGLRASHPDIPDLSGLKSDIGAG